MLDIQVKDIAKRGAWVHTLREGKAYGLGYDSAIEQGM
ncbi:hypothetical protein S7335_2306 [Synechococcus sp. PCC 7335]|nr:hypothetical protein S7335_2306 [Synechococcus sp. PCC 7335]